MDFIEADVLSDKSEPETRSSPEFRAAVAQRNALLDRLETEEEEELHEKLAKCGRYLRLNCSCCGGIRETETRCDQKWCPVCSRKRAARLSLKYQRASALMKWPMHVTLTRTNTHTIDFQQILALKKGFKKLRRRDPWQGQVIGGISALEITNTGRGWHPHLHVLCDCEWLAVETPAPKHFHSRATKAQLYKRASAELERAWSDCIGQMFSSLKVRRCDGATAVREVLKYTVKPGSLVESPDKIGDAIRAISAGRLVAAFGTLYNMRKELRDETRPSLPCEDCGAVGAWLTDDAIAGIMGAARRDRKGSRRK